MLKNASIPNLNKLSFEFDLWFHNQKYSKFDLLYFFCFLNFPCKLMANYLAAKIQFKVENQCCIWALLGLAYLQCAHRGAFGNSIEQRNILVNVGLNFWVNYPTASIWCSSVRTLWQKNKMLICCSKFLPNSNWQFLVVCLCHKDHHVSQPLEHRYKVFQIEHIS